MPQHLAPTSHSLSFVYLISLFLLFTAKKILTKLNQKLSSLEAQHEPLLWLWYACQG